MFPIRPFNWPHLEKNYRVEMHIPVWQGKGGVGWQNMVDSGSSRSGGLSPISRYYKTRSNPRLWVAVTAFYGPLSTTRRLLIRARLWLQTEGPRLIRSVRWKKCGFLNLSTSAVESEKPEELPAATIYCPLILQMAAGLSSTSHCRPVNSTDKAPRQRLYCSTLQGCYKHEDTDM